MDNKIQKIELTLTAEQIAAIDILFSDREDFKKEFTTYISHVLEQGGIPPQAQNQ